MTKTGAIGHLDTEKDTDPNICGTNRGSSMTDT